MSEHLRLGPTSTEPLSASGECAIEVLRLNTPIRAEFWLLVAAMIAGFREQREERRIRLREIREVKNNARTSRTRARWAIEERNTRHELEKIEELLHALGAEEQSGP